MDGVAADALFIAIIVTFVLILINSLIPARRQKYQHQNLSSASGGREICTKVQVSPTKTVEECVTFLPPPPVV